MASALSRTRLGRRGMTPMVDMSLKLAQGTVSKSSWLCTSATVNDVKESLASLSERILSLKLIEAAELTRELKARFNIDDSGMAKKHLLVQYLSFISKQ